MSEKNKRSFELPDKTNMGQETNEPNKSIETDIRALSVNNIAGPAVVFVGPKESGKTTALLRLARYIGQKEECIVGPNRNFRSDPQYQKVVEFFLDSLHNSDWAPRGNAPIDFITVDVSKKGKPVCQFLEAPGEHYFDSSNPYDITFVPYLNRLFSNRRINKTMVFFFWDGMLDNKNLVPYSTRLCNILNKLDPKYDDVIIVQNKVDKNPELFQGPFPNIKSVKNKLTNNPDFTTFFQTLKDRRLQTQFVAFSSGDFQVLDDGRQRCTESMEDYPRNLWNALKFSLTPGFRNRTKRLNR